MMRRLRRRWRLLTFISILVVGVSGLVAIGDRFSEAGADPVPPSFYVLHRQPVFINATQEVRITYELRCDPGNCVPPEGQLWVRPIGESEFTAIQLYEHNDPDRAIQAYGTVPQALAAFGFDYYARIVSPVDGAEVLMPAGGADAPHKARPLDAASHTIDVASYVFGSAPNPAPQVVASASWGSGPGQLGLIPGAESQSRIGPSSFDRSILGGFVVLDQVNHRIALYSELLHTWLMYPANLSGTFGDIRASPFGFTYVLEETSADSGPRVKVFDVLGDELANEPLAESVSGQLKLQAGLLPFARLGLSEMWAPLVHLDIQSLPASLANVLSPEEQVLGSTAGFMDMGDTGEWLMKTLDNEATFAHLQGGNVVKSWRVMPGGSINVGTVQLFEPQSDGAIVVLALWDEGHRDYVAIWLHDDGSYHLIPVPIETWAEGSPQGNFRLVGSDLYGLQSTAAGVQILKFDLSGGGA